MAGDTAVCHINIAAMRVKVVDTTGAGDAYWGGFLSSLLRQGVRTTDDITRDKLAAAGRYGAVSGGLCIQKSGGIPALPTLTEIQEHMGQKGGHLRDVLFAYMASSIFLRKESMVSELWS